MRCACFTWHKIAKNGLTLYQCSTMKINLNLLSLIIVLVNSIQFSDIYVSKKCLKKCTIKMYPECAKRTRREMLRYKELDKHVSANSLCTGKWIIFLQTELIFRANKSNLRFKWYVRHMVRHKTFSFHFHKYRCRGAPMCICTQEATWKSHIRQDVMKLE